MSLEGNLYIGTSQGYILHFVSIPPDANESQGEPSYIFATRIKPASVAQASTSGRPGVQQILLLPTILKACVLCNGTLSFYTLPELSPALNTTVANCTFVGGVDLNEEELSGYNGVVITICVRAKTRLVRLRDEARKVKDIEYAGCLTCVRRGNFACVADQRSYALLDVENQQKISLFPISSLDEVAASGKVEDISVPSNGATRENDASHGPIQAPKSHNRSTSLGAIVGGLGRRAESPQSRSRDRSGLISPEPGLQDLSASSTGHTRTLSALEHAQIENTAEEKPLPPPPRSSSLRPPSDSPPQATLRPFICSPTPNEFMLVTGTTYQEVGVGIFVNLDGDVVRGTLEFTRYPSSVVLDGSDSAPASESNIEIRSSEGHVLAMIPPFEDTENQSMIEIQRWDLEDGGNKELIPVPKLLDKTAIAERKTKTSSSNAGLRHIQSPVQIHFSEVGNLLRGQKLSITSHNPDTEKDTVPGDARRSKAKREKEEADFGSRLGHGQSSIAVWSGSCIWLAVRNPLVMMLEARMEGTLRSKSERDQIDRPGLIRIMNGIRGQEPCSETEFLGLEFARQKVGLILFCSLLERSSMTIETPPADIRLTESLIMESGLDPRIFLSICPMFSREVVEGDDGIWLHAGLTSTVARCRSMLQSVSEREHQNQTLPFIKRYLNAWRQRKGFGSIADEKQVFQTVDAVLLLVLLRLESLAGLPAHRTSPERAEVYSFVDSGVDCFDRAIEILEQQHQLYVLSRLYQSKRNAGKVLQTWRRIIEGEQTLGAGLIDGENEVRNYLEKIKDTALVDEYGTWLAARNPALGVQVFTNENSRVKWEPHQVVMLLRRRAPNAVKEYLEHLVFGKKSVQYANDLILYYLDSVLAVLGSSEEASNILSQSYATYRALKPPKPTYREFITENAIPAAWWHDRLRLLELIGGSHGSEFSYDVGQVLSRIEPFEQDLVPESIILDGRQGRHKQALRLLTHGLGDYHTAVNYCLLGGASIFHPTQGSPNEMTRPSEEEQSKLFAYLLQEFLRIEDSDDRLERTSELLGRFSFLYEINDVLDMIPSDWSVEHLSAFLVSSFRRLVHERNEAAIVRALSGAENLQVAAALIEKCSELGPHIETDGEVT